MKSRVGLVAIAVGAVVLGLLAPGAVSAAPKAEKPSGEALVHIDGGTAYAKKKTKGEYRIVVPDGAQIDWMGEVEGKGTRVGTFTPKALIAGWARMGHRDGSKAATTVTWKNPGDEVETFLQVYLAKPRINSDGQMTFLASTLAKAPLPQKLDNFSINVRIASDPTTRAFTVSGPYIYLDSAQTTFVYANATDVAAGQVWFAYQQTTNTCRQGIFLGGSIQYTFPGAFPCGVITVNATTTDGAASYAVMAPPPPGSNSSTVGYINASFSATPKGQAAFDIKQTLTAYTKGGGGSGGSTPS